MLRGDFKTKRVTDCTNPEDSSSKVFCKIQIKRCKKFSVRKLINVSFKPCRPTSFHLKIKLKSKREKHLALLKKYVLQEAAFLDLIRVRRHDGGTNFYAAKRNIAFVFWEKVMTLQKRNQAIVCYW